jgi:hypothetical protein
MSTISTAEVNKKINTLPIPLLLEVDKFIDFLNFKEQQIDWANKLTDSQILLINKGKKDITENRIYSSQKAKEMINDYKNSKVK